jgi:hypothetical protein
MASQLPPPPPLPSLTPNQEEWEKWRSQVLKPVSKPKHTETHAKEHDDVFVQDDEDESY